MDKQNRLGEVKANPSIFGESAVGLGLEAKFDVDWLAATVAAGRALKKP
jgi:hypothetical protein